MRFHHRPGFGTLVVDACLKLRLDKTRARDHRGIGHARPLNLLAEIIDYHQHLYGPQAGARSSPGPKRIDADYLVAQLNAAGISRAAEGECVTGPLAVRRDRGVREKLRPSPATVQK
jgi:hypothetical protein